MYFLGLVTVARPGQINWEDARWVQGMNRIRHAYLELAPELEPYFVTSQYDDDLGILQSSMARSQWPPRTQAFVAVPGVVAVIDSVVAGAVAGIAANGLDLSTASALALGGGAFLMSLSLFFAWGWRQIARGMANLEPRFPRPQPDEG